MTIFALLISLVIWGFLFWLAWWGLAKIALPEPFNKAATVILVVAAIVIIYGLLSGTIHTFPFLTLR